MITQANAIHIPLADKSVHCAVTSPPYWGLRKYSGDQGRIWGGDPECEHEWGDELIVDKRHQWKPGHGGLQDKQVRAGAHKRTNGQFCQLCSAWYGSLGLEPTPEQHIENIVKIFREVHRVLRDDGVCFLNYGDAYMSENRRAEEVASISDIDAAWLAALVDSDGSITITRNRRANGKTVSYHATIAVTQTKKQMVEKAHKLCGGATRTEARPDRERTFFRWYMAGQQAAPVLRAIYPHLLLKQAQAALAIMLCEHVTKMKFHKSNPATQEALDYREALKESIRRLNALKLTIIDPVRPKLHKHGLAQGNLLLMPHRVAIALAEDGWIIRQDLVWFKRNPMPESIAGTRWVKHRIKEKRSKHATDHNIKGGTEAMLRDASIHQGIDEDWVPEYVDCPGCEKCIPNDGLVLKRGSWRHTRAHEYIFQLVKGPKMSYWSNQEAVRVATSGNTHSRGIKRDPPIDHAGQGHDAWVSYMDRDAEIATAGRNPRSVLDVPTHPYSLGTKSGHWRRVVKDAASDGTMHIAFPYCREHGDLAVRLAKQFYGGREADFLSRIERIYDHLARERSGGSFPTHQHGGHCSEPCNSDWLPPVYSPAAIDHSNASHKKALALETAIPYMPFFEMIGYIDDKQELLSYFAQHLCIYGSRIVSDDLPASLLQRIPHHILDKVQAETLKASDCSCLIYEHYTKIADHYATFPPNLIAPLIRATCPRWACPVCGQGWAAVVANAATQKSEGMGPKGDGREDAGLRTAERMGHGAGWRESPSPATNVLGYRKTCEHEHTQEEAVPGICLDPFLGSGTVGAVCNELQRRWIGIDISMEYLDEQARYRANWGEQKTKIDDLPLFQIDAH